jgi:hypothetical protein
MKMEPSSRFGPHQRARVAIGKEINIKTDDNAKLTKSNRSSLAAQNKTHGNGKRAKTHHASKGLLVKRASKKNGVIHIRMLQSSKTILATEKMCFSSLLIGHPSCSYLLRSSLVSLARWCNPITFDPCQ